MLHRTFPARRLAPSSRRRARTCLGISGFAALALLAAPLAAQSPVNVTGLVVERGTGLPVAHARVLVIGSDRSGVSDESGRFVVRGVPSGTVTLSVQRLGYAESTTEVSAGGDLADIVIEVERAPVLSDPIVVTATRREERLIDLPVAVGVITVDDVQEMRPTHVAQPLNRIAGVHIVEFEGDGTHNSIRQPLCCKPTLLIMEDGIPFSSPAFYSTSMIGWVNYAQGGGIEVLKGPGTATYGSDAVTGVINFISAPTPVSPTGSISVEAGEVGYRRIQGSAGGAFGSHGVNAYAQYWDSDGRRNNPQQTFSANAVWDAPGPFGGSFRTRVSFIDDTGVGSADQTLELFEARSTFNPYPIDANFSKVYRGSTTYETNAGGTSLRITPFVRYFDRSLVPTWQFSYNPVVWQHQSRSLGLFSQGQRDLSFMDGVLTFGADVDYSPVSRQQPVISGTTDTDDEGRTIWTDWSLTAEDPQYDYDATYFGTALYGQLELEPVDRLEVTLGARYDRASYDYTNNLSVVTDGFIRRPADTEVSYSRLTPKLGATLDLTNEWSLFGSYREGFRVPTVDQLFTQGSSESALDLKPVEATSWEAGMRYALGSRMRIEAAAYDLDLTNDILRYRAPNGVTGSTNNGATHSRGLELSGSFAVTPQLTLDAAWTFAEHTFEEWQVSEDTDFSGNVMDGAPEQIRNVYLTWRPQLLRGASLSLEWLGMGGYWIDAENQKWQEGYDVFHLRAAVDLTPNVELFGRVMNLTNHLYATQVFNGFGNIDRLFAPAEYRTVYFGLRVRL